MLDDSKSGLIPKKELQEAIAKVADENNLDIDKAELKKLVDQIYQQDDGSKASKISRKSVREALEVSSRI